MSVDDAHEGLVEEAKRLGVFENTYWFITSDVSRTCQITVPLLNASMISVDPLTSGRAVVVVAWLQPWAPPDTNKQISGIRPLNTHSFTCQRTWDPQRSQRCAGYQRRLRTDVACHCWASDAIDHGR